MKLSSSPVDALLGGVLVVGCERQESGDIRLYLGSRHLDEYVTVTAGENADAAERAWKITNTTHLWMCP